MADLSLRAMARLKRARMLMQRDPLFFGLSSGWKLNDAGARLSDAIQAAIDGLAPDKREQLRGLVDWVEEYDQTEAAVPRPRKTHSGA